MTSDERSRLMSRIRGKDTKPELLIRKGLFSRGYRYRLHRADLPGKPDLVLPLYNAVIFVNGCFWHGHNCHLFKLPKTNTEFWATKIKANCRRDEKNRLKLIAAGWRVIEVWECSLRGKHRMELEQVIGAISDWLTSNNSYRSVHSLEPLMTDSQGLCDRQQKKLTS